MNNEEKNENKEAAEAPGPFKVLSEKNVGMNFFYQDNDNRINDNINDLEEKIDKLSINKNEKKKKLVPRKYQLAIYEKAKHQNSIIYVETGKGKTFISIMLMADLLGIDIYSDEKKKTKN